MRWLVLVCCLFLLTGCSAQPVWETVEDILPAEGQFLHNYDISLELPLTYLGGNGKDCLYASGTLEVETASFHAADLDAAVRWISGFSPEQLNMIKTVRDDLPEYQFAWYSQTEEGGRLFRADLVMDGTACYAVICSAPETAEGFHEQARAVFSSFNLSETEKV